MGIFSFLNKNEKSKNDFEEVNFLYKHDFIGNQVKSKNDRFLLGFRDQYYENDF